ncbi:hypothetical protein DZF91_31705 [Actinomadura logoneensis]|uniref:Uncharacterized protein n=1 Tax=Actinomadura logoneensis TaxID=2293572 RepID=A0A372JCG3_9ACTN|nr:hypothetical protein [Actinomadura logoneensis]RFU37662.1 hypothetical protein DZF91_31705 [Actinomadura logoneensis]
MFQTVEGGRYRCALVIRLDDGVDAALLAAIGSATGLAFEEYGTGGFGGETLATVWKAGDDLLIEAECDEAGVRALLVRAGTAERAVAIRSAIGEHMPAWSEQMLRAQLADTFADAPQALVALLMAAGGARPEDETRELLRRALDHEDEEVRHFAEYAATVAAELEKPPVVMREDRSVRELDELLRPARPVKGKEHWVTVRAGVPERAVPRPVTWLRTSLDDTDDVLWWIGDQYWEAVVMRNLGDRTWLEDIYLAPDKGTALHVVLHDALGTVHLALHGGDVEATAAKLAEDVGAEVLPSAPPGLASTGSGQARAE